MAFSRDGLRLTSTAGAASTWSYATSDSLATVAGAGYFNAIADQARVGDVIHVVSGSTYGRFVVSANTGAAVTLVGWAAAAAQAQPTAPGSGATGGAFSSSTVRDEWCDLILQMRTALINHGLIKGAA